MISFYETLRVEIGREVGITIVTPGLVESEMTKGKFLSKEGQLVLDQQLRDVSLINYFGYCVIIEFNGINFEHPMLG